MSCTCFSARADDLRATKQNDLTDQRASGDIVAGPDLDDQFRQLREAQSESDAQRVEAQLKAMLNASGSATVDLLMVRASVAVKEEKYALALDLLDQVVLLRPEFVEGWNRRAQVHFVLQDYTLSLRDLEKVLSLEPRHVWAMIGLGVIMRELKRPEEALRVYRRVLEHYPLQTTAREAVVQLRAQLRGSGI
ncbi:tetratricopeptide repeat protein [Polycladidibacter hongkongensis]|uniref:tetratricopeptide repeat protein n=1 Tax=Polycladidibacter hongkongensis TaxID=1647556 RepID=UPI00155E9FDC|nr:tetratricopeptide repeat protein [Pseudovibrio hongkongensis]